MFSLVNVPEKLPLLCINHDVLLPGAAMKIPVTSKKNINLVTKHLMNQGVGEEFGAVIGVISSKSKLDFKETNKMVGTASLVMQVVSVNWPKQIVSLMVVGVQRFMIERIVNEEPYPVAMVKPIIDKPDFGKNGEAKDLIVELRNLATQLVDALDLLHPMLNKMKRLVAAIPDSTLLDTCASLVNASFNEKLEILTTVDFIERLKKVIPLVNRHVESLGKLPELSKKGELDRRGVSMIKLLRTRLPQADSLLDKDDKDDLTELHNALKKAEMPPNVEKVAMKEFQRLKRMGTFNPEYSVMRNYIELIAELPWSCSANQSVDLAKAKVALDSDHYGMEKLKRRVLEHLAVRQLQNNLKGPILCFVGPPGVGKTSIGRSIASTLGTKFHRISLGGICNQSDIRGHRRTYVGALPGRIIQALKTVGVNNPVILLDEIDKLGSSSHGDPGAALLEVLDPEQNCLFVDHYLNVPFNLSQVTFIATANKVNSIPSPLRDRMEVIYISGYTQEEKYHILQNHLLPKQVQLHGLKVGDIILEEEAIKMLIGCYTQEAGVRCLERKLAGLCRAMAVKVASPNEDCQLPVTVTPDLLKEILGIASFSTKDIWWKTGARGVAVGLAWTQAGGELMVVETSKFSPGTGQLVLTGKLGSVIKESASLALNWLRTQASKYGLVGEGEDLMTETDVHVHFPVGAVSKDGPSGGVAIAVALVSLFTGLPVASDLALTGEISLHGAVLPVGKVKEKVLAAYRAGLGKVILPKKCEKYLQEIPKFVQDGMRMVLVERMEEVLEVAFTGSLGVTQLSIPTLSSKL